MKRVNVVLEFAVPDDTDVDAFGERVLQLVESGGDFTIDADEMLHLAAVDPDVSARDLAAKLMGQWL